MPPTKSGDQARSFLPLSPQVFQVLLSLHQGRMHGYSIIQDISERTRGEISLTASTLYDALARLVDREWILEVESSSADDDARRRYYELTSLGRRVCDEEVLRLERLLRSARATQKLGKSSVR